MSDLLPPSIAHSFGAALWLVGIAAIAWALDAVVEIMRKHQVDPILCGMLRYTALSLAVLDCGLVLHFAITSALAAIST